MEILSEFRSELEEEGHLKPNETLGTDDETLMLGYFVLDFFLSWFIWPKDLVTLLLTFF